MVSFYDDVIKWKHFPRFWPFVRGIHWSPVDSPCKGQWHGALMISLICAWTNGIARNRDAGDLRCHRTHYDVTVMSHSRNNTSKMKSCYLVVISLKSMAGNTILTGSIASYMFKHVRRHRAHCDVTVMSDRRNNTNKMKSCYRVVISLKSMAGNTILTGSIASYMFKHVRRHRAHCDVTVMSDRRNNTNKMKSCYRVVITQKSITGNTIVTGSIASVGSNICVVLLLYELYCTMWHRKCRVPTNSFLN